MRISVTLGIAVAALSLAGCGKTETANTADINFTDMNTSEAIEGSTNDSMTPVDGAAGVSANMTTGNISGNVTATNAIGNASDKAADNGAATAANSMAASNTTAKSK